jgi:hypothetical protein
MRVPPDCTERADATPKVTRFESRSRVSFRLALLYWIPAAVLLVLATIVAFTGGLRGTVLGVPFSSRRVAPACLAAWVLIVLGARKMDNAELDRRIAGLRFRVQQYATPIAIGLAATTFLVALRFGAFTAAGADPYGYISQAELWAHGNPTQFQSELAMNAPWPNAEWSFCPLGYKPSHVSGLIVPTYAPGLPLQMAVLARVFGVGGSYFIVPLAGALVVWLTYLLGRRVCRSPEAALVSALLAATSPVFLFQLMIPMSDVPVTAWWLASLVAACDPSLAAAVGAGISASLAILTRPNLAPLVIPVCAYLLFGSSRRAARRWPLLVAFGGGLLPGVMLSAAVNLIFYGSPLKSGYGSLPEIYRLSFAAANLLRYPTWLWQTHSPYVFLGLCAPLVLTARRQGILAILFTLVLGSCYVFYIPFDHWTYLRFLLPAIPLLLVTATAAVDTIAGVRTPRVHATALAMIATVLGLSYVHTAVRGDAFTLRRLFADRYQEAAATVTAQTPRRAAVLCLLQSGSLRYYADRLTVRYDLIPPEWLSRGVEYVHDNGWAPYVAIESTETGDFARRFGQQGASLLKEAPPLVLDPMHLVTLFGPLK